MSLYPLALVILLSFAGGWVWRGVFDLWRHPKAKVYGTTNVVWGESSGTGVVVTPTGNAALGETTWQAQNQGRLHSVDHVAHLRAVD